MHRKGFAPLLTVLIIVLLSSVAVFGYQSFQKAQSKGLINKNTYTLQTQSPSACKTAIPEEISPYFNNNGLKIIFGKNVSSEMRNSIAKTVENKPNNIFKNSKEIAITSSTIESDWVFLSVSATDGPCYSPETPSSAKFCAGTLILQRLNCNEWKAAIIGTTDYLQLLEKAPDIFLSQEAKNAFKQESLEWSSQ